MKTVSWTKDAPKLVELYKQGKSLKEMSQELPGRTERAIKNKLEKLGWSTKGL